MIDFFIELFQTQNHFLILTAGVMVGLIHAFEPDHVSAMSTRIISAKSNLTKKQSLRNLTAMSSWRGMIWGFGHTSSIIIIGVLIAGLSLNIGNEFFLGAEFIVGIMLIALGVFTIRNRNILGQSHIHPHTHENGISHVHTHNHNTDHKHDHKSFIIGSIHGIAGSGSLVALTASVFMGFETMMYFLVLFGIGSIIGMTVISGIIGLPFILSSKMKQVTRYLRYGISGITILIGTNVILTIVSNYKLF
jgi:sulfite exporter TauE/SafE